MKEISQLTARLEKLLSEKFGIRPRGLERGLRKAGRRLPKRLRLAGREIVAAQKLSGHPKLSRQIDMTRLRRAGDQIAFYLEGIDTADRRKGAVLSVLAGLAFNLLLLGGVIVGFAAWRGWL